MRRLQNQRSDSFVVLEAAEKRIWNVKFNFCKSGSQVIGISQM